MTQSVKTIHFLRHAQGEHNIAGEADPIGGYFRDDLLDAVLSPFGVAQCLAFAESSILHKELDMVIVSPMRRTLQTAMQCFPEVVDSIPFIAVEEVREQTGLHPCDCRLSIDELRTNFPKVCFDQIENVEDPLYHLYSTEREPDSHVHARAHKFFEWLFQRKESNVMIVTHSAFLRCVFRSVLQVCVGSEVLDNPTIQFANCEVKTVQLEYPSLKAHLIV